MILYISTAFEQNAGNIVGGNATTGGDGYGISCLVNNIGEYGSSAGMNTVSTARQVGLSLVGQTTATAVGPYHQVTSANGNFTSAGEEPAFAIGFCNTADMDIPTWITTTTPVAEEEQDWAGTSADLTLHTPSLTEDVYTLIIPTTNTLRQATTTRNGNSIVFHIPQNSLAVYAINANLNTANTIVSSMTDQQASAQILEYGYGLILKTAGETQLYNQA
jgi:hypothetical protein